MFGFGGKKERGLDKEAQELAAQPRVFYITDKGRQALYLVHKGNKELLTLPEISVLLRARHSASYAELTAAVNNPKTLTKEELIQFTDELLSGPDPSDKDWGFKYMETPRFKKAHEIIRNLVHNGLIEG